MLAVIILGVLTGVFVLLTIATSAFAIKYYVSMNIEYWCMLIILYVHCIVLSVNYNYTELILPVWHLTFYDLFMEMSLHFRLDIFYIARYRDNVLYGINTRYVCPSLIL